MQSKALFYSCFVTSNLEATYKLRLSATRLKQQTYPLLLTDKKLKFILKRGKNKNSVSPYG